MLINVHFTRFYIFKSFITQPENVTKLPFNYTWLYFGLDNFFLLSSLGRKEGSKGFICDSVLFLPATKSFKFFYLFNFANRDEFSSLLT